VTIAIVGKVHRMKDAYKSLRRPCSTGDRQQGEGQSRLDRERGVRKQKIPRRSSRVNGILVPGGFGQRGAEGKIRVRSSHGSAPCPISVSVWDADGR